MRSVLSVCLAICLVSVPTVVRSGSIGHDLSLNLPPGWIIISDTLTFPVHLINDGADAQMSVFRSEFSATDAVRNQAELKGSVQKVIDDVILTLPEAKVLTSTGFNETYRAGFVLEFVSQDTSAQMTLRHRFEGLLYRLDDNRQVLFTLWAKTPLDSYANSEIAIREIQSSFEYRGPQEASVFPPRINPYVVAAILMLLGIGLVMYTRSRRWRRSSDDEEAFPGDREPAENAHSRQ
jgi:hypothetical protein